MTASRRKRRAKLKKAAGERSVDPIMFTEWDIPMIRPCEGDPEVTNKVRDAIELLSQRDQDMLTGMFYAQESKANLAERYGVSRHVIAGWCKTALIHLKEALSENL
jgi:hypothetical protein